VKVKLTKLIGGDRVRTPTVEGDADCLPEVGRPFVMIAESFVIPGGIRLVATSDVQAIVTDDTGACILETLNSTYKLEVSDKI
jgi:hypothetical protein